MSSSKQRSISPSVQNRNQSPLRERSLFVIREKDQDKQHSYYRKSRVDSCSYVFVKGGTALAVPYYTPTQLEKVGQDSSTLYSDNRSRSFSEMQDSYGKKHISHVGERFKPLEPYNANAYRNRLVQILPKIGQSNDSSIVLGNPIKPYKRTYVTTSQLYYEKPVYNFSSLQTNEGILSEQIKFQHYKQNR